MFDFYIKKRYTFNAKHSVKLRGEQEQAHEHHFMVNITFKGNKTGDVIEDFGQIDKLMQTHILNRLENINLNTILKNPTVENLAQFIWNSATNLHDNLALYEIEVCEDKNNCVFVRYRT